MEDMGVLNLQFAFLVTGRDLNPVQNAYECLKQNTACGKYHGTGDTEDLQGDYEVVLWDDLNTPVQNWEFLGSIPERYIEFSNEVVLMNDSNTLQWEFLGLVPRQYSHTRHERVATSSLLVSC